MLIPICLPSLDNLEILLLTDPLFIYNSPHSLQAATTERVGGKSGNRQQWQIFIREENSCHTSFETIHFIQNNIKSVVKFAALR